MRSVKIYKREVVALTMDEAKHLGIVRCQHCGYPPNNHFEDGKSAFDNNCPGYAPKFVLGRKLK